MGIFPKLKTKSVQTFAGGGYISPVTDPINGVGIQYVPTAADVPNLEAVKYLDATRRASDEKLDIERRKLMPSEQAARDLIMKQPGTAGQKDLLTQDTLAAIKDYRDKAKKNINWVFTDEGRNALTKVENVLSPGKFQALSDASRQLQEGHEMSYKNGTDASIQVRSGRVSVIDSKDGKRKDIPLKEYESDSNSEKPQFTPITVNDAYNLATSEKNYDLSGHKVYGDMYNAEQAKSELRSYFNNTGNTGTSNGIVSTKSNAYQRDQAKKQAIAGLSERSKESLQSEYISLHKGKYNNKEFNNWVGNLLDEESNKRKIFDQDVNLQAQLALAKANGSSDSSGGGNIETPINTNYPVTRDTSPINPFGAKTVDLHLISRGVVPDKSIKPLVVNGDVHSFADTFLGNKNSEENGGKPVRVSKTFRNAQHVENATFAVTTGKVLKTKKDGTTETLNNGDSGSIIIKNKDYNNGIPANAELQQDNDENGKPYLYFENKDHDRVIVESKGFKVYDTFGEDDGKSDLKKESKVFLPMDRKESLANFGVNYSGEHHKENHFLKKGSAVNLTIPSYNILASIIQNASANNPKYASAMIQLLKEAQSGSWRAQKGLNEIINENMDNIDDHLILKTFMVHKESFTPKDETDNRNFEN